MIDVAAVLEGAAITTVFTLGSIFSPARELPSHFWQELTSCPLCLGWWVGAALVARDAFAQPAVPGAIYLVGHGALTGCAALLYRRIIDRIDR